MKQVFCAFLFLVGFQGLTTAQGIKTNATVRSCMFMHPVEGTYVETYLVVAANALNAMETPSGTFTAGVDVSIVILDNSSVLNFDKYRLNTPSIADTTKIMFSIIDQKRLFIPNKTVSVEVTITDVHDQSNVFSSTEVLTSFVDDAVQISDIQFAESYRETTENTAFVKNGLELQPYPINFFPSSTNKLLFYGEVYGSDAYMGNEQFLIAFTIRPATTDAVNDKFFQYVKSAPAPVVPFLTEFDISDLPGGNYNLVVEVRDQKNTVITQKKVFIQRANAGAINAWENIQMINTAGTFTETYTEEQLNYFLDVIRPRASQSEMNIIESLSPRTEAEMKRKFLYNFWVERNASDPHGEWKKYLQLVKEANDEFSTPSREGYKTDRGRVYLQYGRPWDMVTSVNEPGAYPYELWFYTTLPDKQTNIGFAFYEPSRVSNDYILLHSNARGELQDPRWKIKLYEAVASPQEVLDLDNTDVSDKLGGHRAVDMYNF